MTARHVIALSDDRHDVAAALERIDERRHAGDIEVLQGSIERSLDTFRRVAEDGELWDRATAAVDAEFELSDAAQIESLRRWLPPILDLFGYLPPPPSEQLIDRAVGSISDLADGQVTPDEVVEARGALWDAIVRIEDVLPDLNGNNAAIVANEVTSWQTGLLSVAGGAATSAATTAIQGLILGSLALPPIGAAAAATAGVVASALLMRSGIRSLRRRRDSPANELPLAEMRVHPTAALLGAIAINIDRIEYAADELRRNPEASTFDLDDALAEVVALTRHLHARNDTRTTEQQQRTKEGRPGPLIATRLAKELYEAAKKHPAWSRDRVVDDDALDDVIRLGKELGAVDLAKQDPPPPGRA